MSVRPWYDELFGDDYLRAWAPTLPPERTAREVEQIEQLLSLPPGSAILDLCCGHGRHAIQLAARGWRVVGLDRSERFLRQAVADAAALGVRVRWVRADMRAVPFAGQFDAAINIFTAFGYFDSDAENLEVLRQVRQALRPGGRFLLEFMHREGIARRFRPAMIDRHPDGLVVLHENRFDLPTSRIEGRVTLLHPDGRRAEYRHTVRVYTATELAAMFAAAGLPVEHLFGGLDGSELTLDSGRLAVIGRRDG
jgi:SAM-dependent methyltransferase